MAYFSNGMEGDYYRERFCNRCLHDVNEDCPVYLLHLLYNYDQIGETEINTAVKTFLDALWPRDGFHNGDCKMFIWREANNA